MNYQEAITYLQNLTRFGINFGLGRIENLLDRLGNPHKSLKIIHVGGTNGKGSVATMVTSILQAQGYQVGTFTSPHLQAYTERYKINGLEISQERVAKLIAQVKPLLKEMAQDGVEHPTEFEVSTALAFLYFCQEKVDFLVLEVGLGGAIDSTNVAMPLVSVITNVAMDHMDYLGHSLTEIAKVKAGIIKDCGLVATAAQAPEVLEVIREVCRQKGAKLLEVHKDCTWQINESTNSGQRFDLTTLKGTYKNLQLKLIGRHQVINAATAVATCELLADKGFTISSEAVCKGLSEARWPGRLEIMQHNPMVLVDGAHNLAGAQSLRQALEELFTYRQLIMVIGMLGDKEREKVVAELAPLAQIVVVTKPNSPRAGDWEAMAKTVKEYTEQVYLIEDIGQAVKKALALAGQQDLICITGSLYMIAEARERWVGKP